MSQDIIELQADIENGFTQIANLLLEALTMAKLNGTQKGICMFLWRRTYGWGKSDDAVSLREYSEACGTSQSYISRQLNELLKKKVVIRVKYEPGKTPVYTFNTRVSQWDKGCLNVQDLSNRISQGLSDCARVGLSDCARVNQEPALEPPGIEAPVNKVLNKKKETYIYPPNSSEVILSEYLLSLIKRHLPNIRDPDIQKWAKHMNALIRIDGRHPTEVKAVIEFAQTSEFWQGNILSTDKLRKQYDTLNAQRLRNIRNNEIRSHPKKTSYPGDDYEIYDKFSRSRPSSEDDDKFSRRGKSFCDI